MLDGIGAPTVQWASSVSSAGTVNFDSPSIAVNKTTGKSAVGGTFSGTVTFSTTSGPQAITAPDLADIFVAQLDATGAWTSVGVITTGGIANDTSSEVAMDSAGNVFIAGSFQAKADFDPGAGVFPVTSAGLNDAFVVTIDASGALVRAQTFGGVGNDGGAFPAIGPDGHLHSGFFTVGAKVDLDAGAGTFFVDAWGQNARLVFVEEDGSGGIGYALDSFGGMTLAGAGKQSGEHLIIDAGGSIYAAGVFTGTLAFSPASGLPSLTSTDADGNVFVVKFDPAGTILWAGSVQMSLTLDLSGNDNGLQVLLALDGTGGVYLASEYEVSASFFRPRARRSF